MPLTVAHLAYSTISRQVHQSSPAPKPLLSYYISFIVAYTKFEQVAYT